MCILNKNKKKILVVTALSIVCLGCSLLSWADEVPRFDFSKSLRLFENHRDRYFERITFDSTVEEFKKHRIEQIEGIKNEYSSYSGSVHVSALFNITADVPEGLNLYEHHESIVWPHLELLTESLNEDEKDYARIRAVGELYLASNHDNTQHYEKIDLFIDKVFVKHIVEHPMFLDIAFAGTTEGIAFNDSSGEMKIRLSDNSSEKRYSNSLLRKGYYKEVVEALALKSWVNVHIQLNETIELSNVMAGLDQEDFKVIRKTDDELLITINSSSARSLIHDSRVKLIKDYEYHHDLELARGKWNPYPLSVIQSTSEDEISKLYFRNRSNLYDVETQVFESESQLNSFLNSINTSEMKDAYKSARDIEKVDFSKKNLILYSQEEISSMISLKARTPIWIDGELVVVIDRSSRGMLSMDVAQHFFGYLVDKTIPSVTFRSANKTNIVSNSASSKLENSLAN